MPHNSLTHILNVNNTDASVDQEISLIPHSLYYDIDQLVKVLKNKPYHFHILRLNIQFTNAKFGQLRIILKDLEIQNCEFSATFLQETWLSEASDIYLLSLDDYNLISQGKIRSSHGGLAIYLFKKYDPKTLTLCILSGIWEGQCVEIAGVTLHKNIVIGNIYRPPNDLIKNYRIFKEQLIPVLEHLHIINFETKCYID